MYYLQNHPDPLQDIRVVCINCLQDKKMGSFATHCLDCIAEPPAYSDEQLEANKKEKKAPWLAAYLKEPALKEAIQKFKDYGVGRRGTDHFYFLDPQKCCTYNVICTACGWSGSLNRFWPHAIEHQHKIDFDAEESEFGAVHKVSKPSDRSPKKNRKKKRRNKMARAAGNEGKEAASGSSKRQKTAKKNKEKSTSLTMLGKLSSSNRHLLFEGCFVCGTRMTCG
jgi:hypothetical protein